MDVVLLPSFEEAIITKYRTHAERIRKMISRLRKDGKSAVKILDVEGNYVLGEMKSHRPPYRLYVVFNEKKDTCYVVDWKHKKEQENTISELKLRLSLALEYRFETVFGLPRD